MPKRLSDEAMADRSTRVSIPKEYARCDENISPEDQLLASFLKVHNFGDRFRLRYNHFITFRLPLQFKALGFRVGSLEVSFPGIRYVSPRYNGEVLYPRDARFIRTASYSATTFIRVLFKDGDKQREVEVDYGQLPVMVHSILCNLHPTQRHRDESSLRPGAATLDECARIARMTPEEKARINAITEANFQHLHNSDPQDRQLAYFIINGRKMHGKNIDRQRNATFQVESDTCIRFICPGYVTSRVDVMLINAKDGTKHKQAFAIHVHISDLLRTQTSHVNLMLMFRLAGWSFERVCAELQFFVPHTHMQKMRIDLELTELEYTIVYGHDTFGYLRSVLRDDGIDPSTEMPFTDDELRTRVFSKLFRHMNADPTHDMNERKLRLLLMATGELLMHTNGARSPASKDWQSKKVVGLNLASLAQRHLGESVKRMQAYVTSVGDIFSVDISTIQEEFGKLNFTQTFEKSLSGKAWGVVLPNYDSKKLNIRYTEHYNAENLVGAISQTSSTTKNICRQAKNFSKRSTGAMGMFGVCPLETPTGERTGLQERFAITAVISPGTNDDSLIMRLRFTDTFQANFTTSADTVLLINGKFMGWCNGVELEQNLRHLKRHSYIDPYACIALLEEPCKSLRVSTDDGRVMALFHVVEEESGAIMADKYMPGVYDFTRLFQAGYLEFVDPLERISKQTAYSRAHLVERTRDWALKDRHDSERRLKMAQEAHDPMDYRSVMALRQAVALHESVLANYTSVHYVPIHESSVLGTCASVLPLLQHNAAVRTSFGTKLQAQAISTELRTQSDTVFRQMLNGARPVYDTVVGREIGLDSVHHSMRCTVAVIAFPDTEEDSIIVNQASIDRGLGMFMLTKIKDAEETEQIAFGILPGTEAWRIYRNINPRTGLPLANRVFRGGDVLVARVERGVVARDIHLAYGEVGTVKSVFLDTLEVKNGVTIRRVSIVIRIAYPFTQGGKLTPPEGQKGVCGARRAAVDMPILVDRPGTMIDMIVNPAPFGGRMTMASMPHMLYGGVQPFGGTWTATPFTRFNPVHLDRIFIENGLRSDGMERILMPDGRILGNTRIYVGSAMSVMLLHHFVQARIHVRGHNGPRSGLTRQPGAGRSAKGGFRWGIMERDQLMGQGCVHAGLSRGALASDAFEAVVCRNCYLRYEQLLFSQARCRSCGKSDFAKVLMRYTMVGIQNLLAMSNIKMEFAIR